MEKEKQILNEDEQILKQFLNKIHPTNDWDPVKKAIIIKGPKPDDADEWEAIFQEEHPGE